MHKRGCDCTPPPRCGCGRHAFRSGSIFGRALDWNSGREGRHEIVRTTRIVIWVVSLMVEVARGASKSEGDLKKRNDTRTHRKPSRQRTRQLARVRGNFLICGRAGLLCCATRWGRQPRGARSARLRMPRYDSPFKPDRSACFETPALAFNRARLFCSFRAK